MGLDATSLGIQVFFIVLLPGFMFFISFRWAGGFRGKAGEFGSICTSALLGIMLFPLWRWTIEKDSEKFVQLLSSPINAGATFSVSALFVGAFIGWLVGYIRHKVRY